MVRSPDYRGHHHPNASRHSRGSPQFSRGSNRRSPSPNRRRPLSRNEGNNGGNGDYSRRYRSPNHSGGGGNRPLVASMRMRMDDYTPPKHRRNEKGHIIPPLMEQTVARARKEASTRTKDTFWTKKLLDAEDQYSRKGDRWAHSGFKEMYKDELGYAEHDMPGPSSDKSPRGTRDPRGVEPKDPRRGNSRPRDPRQKQSRIPDKPKDPRIGKPLDPRQPSGRRSRSRSKRGAKRGKSGSRSYSSGSSSSSGSYSRSSYSSSRSSSFSSSSSSRSRSRKRGHHKRRRSRSYSSSFSSSVTPPPNNRVKQPARGQTLKDKKPVGGPAPPSIQDHGPQGSKSLKSKKMRPKVDDKKKRRIANDDKTGSAQTPVDLSKPPPPIGSSQLLSAPLPVETPVTVIQKKHKKEKPYPTPQTRPPPPSAGALPVSPPHPLHSSSESSSSDEEEVPRKMTLSERFGKLAQLSSQRQEYDGVRMKIVREGGQDKKVYLEGGHGSRSPSPLHPGHERWLAEHQTEYAEYQQRYGDIRSWDPHRDLPNNLPPNWEEVSVRYRYYKQSGYFGDRHISLEDYLKWEEWWYQYRDWLKKYGSMKDGGRDWGDRGADGDQGGVYSSRWPPQDSGRDGMDRKRRRY